MKKALFFILLISILFWLHMPIYAFYSANVYGYKYFSRKVEGQVGFNSSEVLVFNPPYYNISENKKILWSHCQNLNKNIKQQLARYHQFNEENLPYFYIVEKNDNSYKTYINNGKSIIYIHSFPDWGGEAPSPSEMMICDDS